MRAGGPGCEAASPAGLVRAPMRVLDAMLRRRFGIVEFSRHPDCLLRISRGVAPHAVAFADGTEIAPGAPVLRFHLWNERLPRVPPGGPDLRWALCLRDRFAVSLHLLARHVADEPALGDVAALWSSTALATRRSAAAMGRIGARLGFDMRPAPTAPGPAAALRRLGESLFVGGLVWTYNPSARRAPLRRVPFEMWMSRAQLLGRYGARDGPAVQPLPAKGVPP